MNYKMIGGGVVAAVGVAAGIYGFAERRAVKKEFKRLEKDFQHLEHRVKGRR